MKNFLNKKKILFSLCLAFIIIFILFFYLSLNSYKQQALNSRKNSLQLLANEKALLVNNFLENKKETLQVLSSLSVFKDAALAPDDPDKIMEVKQIIQELKEYVPGIGILTKEGIVVVAENTPAGTDYSSLPQFPANDQSKITFLRYYDIARKKDFYAIGGPIYDKVEKTKVIGAISINVDLEAIAALMEETLDKGDSDEVYLIDNSGLLLSSSEYIGQGNKNGILIQEVKSKGAQECLEDLDKYKKDDTEGEGEEVEEHEEEVIRYKNYMGDDVFGAHAYTPEIMGCVIAEESADEKMSSSILGYLKSIFSK